MNNTDNNVINKIVTEKAIEAWKPDINKIKKTVEEIKKINEEILNIVDYKNKNIEAFNRLHNYNRLLFSKSSELEWIADGIRYSQYVNNKGHEDDKDIVYKYNLNIFEQAKQAYIKINELRELITNQTLIYTIGTDVRHEALVTEDRFLSFLSVPNKGDYVSSSYNKLTFSKIDWNNIDLKNNLNEDFLNNIRKSRDTFYKAIASISKEVPDKSKVINNGSKYEAYQFMRARFNFDYTRVISEKECRSVINEWIDFSKGTYNTFRLNSSGDKIHRQNSSLASLEFYQGGDIASNRKDVIIQSKLSNASISIDTIINAVKKICIIFEDVGNVKVNEVLKMFTATGISKKIKDSAFNKANKYAKENIRKAVKSLKI